MVDLESSPRTPRDGESWPRSATIIAGLAVSATVGLAMVAYVLAVSGGETSGRLIAVMPIYFIATFALVFGAFWAIYSAVAWYKRSFGDGVLGTREHAAAVLLTFVLVSVLQMSQANGIRQMQEAAPSPPAFGISAAQLRDATPHERLVAAQSAALHPDAFTVLMRDPDPQVRLALTARADVPGELLDFLAADRVPEVRRQVAASPKAADEILRRLAYDREESVRLAVAGNPTVLAGVLEILAESTPAVRAAVAQNPRTPRETLRILAEDGDPQVAGAAVARLGQQTPSR